MEGKDCRGLTLEKICPTFSRFNAVPAKATKNKFLLKVLPDEICLISSS